MPEKFKATVNLFIRLVDRVGAFGAMTFFLGCGIAWVTYLVVPRHLQYLDDTTRLNAQQTDYMKEQTRSMVVLSQWMKIVADRNQDQTGLLGEIEESQRSTEGLQRQTMEAVEKSETQRTKEHNDIIKALHDMRGP